MNREDFSKTELLRELESLRQQLVAYHLSSAVYEDDRASLSLKNFKYDTVFNNLPIGVITLDNDGHILSANQAIAELLDLPPAKIINKNISETLLLFKATDLAHHFTNLLSRDQSFDFETPLLITHSGTPLYLRCIGIPVQSDAASGVRHLLLFGDITKHRLTHEALRRSEEKYRDLIENIDQIIFAIDLDGNITFVSRATESILGHRPEDIIGTSFVELFVHDDIKEALKHFSQMLGGHALTAECRIKAKSGELRQMRISGKPVFHGDRVRGIYGYLVDLMENKQIERALRDGHERFRRLFETASDAILLINENGIIDCNPKTQSLLRCHKKDILNHSFYHFSPARQPNGTESKMLAKEKIAEGLSGHAQFFEWIFLRFDGQPFYTEVSLSRIEFSGNMNLLAIVHDITDRKNAEEKLKDSHNRVLMVLDSLDAAVFVRDMENNDLLFANKQVRDQNDYFSDEIFANLPAINPAYPELTSQETHGNHHTPVTTLREYQHPTDLKWYQIRERAIRWVDGRIVRLEIATDITARKIAETRLQESEERLRTLINAMPDIICFKDGEGRWLEANRAFLELFQLKTLEYRGLKDADLASHNPFYQELFLSWQAADEKIWSSGSLTRISEVIPRPNHPVKIYDIIKIPLFYGDGRRKGLVVIGRDITEQKQLEEQLRQAQKMEAIGRLAGGVAHDFNNLLTIIQGYSEILLGLVSENDVIYKGIKQINSAANRAESLTEQLLAFSRRQVIQVRVIDLNELIRDLESLLRRLIGEDIELRFDLQQNLGHIKTDPHQMEQVVMNMIVNSRDAMPDGGVLTIETRNVEIGDEQARTRYQLEASPHVMLAISDSGMGMDRETQAKIFEPFFTTKAKGEGTGLGLATVYGIVKQNNGHIWVYSEPGQGATFKIYLPRIDEEISSPEEKPQENLDLHGSETILVVEDENDVRSLISEILLMFGYDVIEAANGQQAISKCKTHGRPVGLVLTDVVMPQMSGRELIEQMILLQANVKVIFMSGYTDSTVTHKGILKTGGHFLQKPFTPYKLARKIRQVLDAK